MAHKSREALLPKQAKHLANLQKEKQQQDK